MRSLLLPLLAVGLAARHAPATEIAVNLSAHNPQSGVTVRQQGQRLRIHWPIAAGEHGELLLDLRAGQPLIEQIGIAEAAGAQAMPLVRHVDPVTLLTVGSRDLSKHGWNVFFDNPPRRPYETFRAALEPTGVAVSSHGRRTTIALDGLSAGPFAGELHFTLYPNCRLVHVETVVSTDKDSCAILYDAGLTCADPDWQTVAWIDTDDKLQRVRATALETAAPVAVRHRAIVAEGAAGSLAVFPPPHRFIYPLDFADNLKLVWHGKGWQKQVNDWGLGVRQPPEGDKRWVPWVNAPPRSRQRLDVFYLLSKGQAPQALDEVRRFTHGDRFRKLDGYKTFTHHYHIEHTFDFLREQRQQKTDDVPRDLETPPFVTAFRAHGVDIVQLAEFHTQHTPELNAQRLHLLRTMHRECRRLSDERFLLLPGEEPNVHLGGHWISMFPRPVYWQLHPAPGTPFEQQVKGLGTVYAVHTAGDVLRLMEKENGLMWTAHPRTKGSYGFPDRYRDEKFFQSAHFLGAGWKHMPADYAQPRLGNRALDLLDDMCNWGRPRYLLGEVDVFKVLPTHELYGHLNINYLKLDELPRFDDGWQPVLDAIRGGRFFVTTGEVLLPEFSVGGKESGQTLRLTDGTTAEVRARLEWTFPPAFAEIIWGDGSSVKRQHVDLSDAEAFSSRVLRVPVDLTGARWVRFEVWDIAANGAFSQPVWVAPSGDSP
jgi:hypothetical protein